MNKYQFKISVVMVCLNAEDFIEKSLKSLASQTYKDYELIVKDGISKDKTIDIVNSLSSEFKNIKIISEADTGIYDAMNQAVAVSSGEYIYFLNAGDLLHSEVTLENIITQLDCDIVYGDMMYGNDILRQPENITLTFFRLERMLCHQSIFAKKEWLLKYPFECKYRYCADRHWLYTCFKSGATFKHINDIIGFYDTTGVSSEWENFSDDSLKVIRDEFGNSAVIIAKAKRFVGEILGKR